jgi:hypothetical protein
MAQQRAYILIMAGILSTFGFMLAEMGNIPVEG